MRRVLVLGPPGTGKTTSLLDVVDEALSRGVAPERIAYVSFTKKAATEARDRAMDRFNIDAGRFPYFKTLHSLGSRIMSLSKDDFMHAAQWKEIGDALGLQNLTGTKSHLLSNETRNNNYANQLLGLIHVARNKKMPLREYVKTLPAQVRNYAIERNGRLLYALEDEINAYKGTFGLRGYTDVILDPVRHKYPPLNVDIAIIDEAQDLTAIQWDFVNHMFSNVKELYIGGDDDQAIYQWNGADVAQFLRLEGERRVLGKSWRLPRRPWMVANWIAQQISQRYEKEWTHKDGEGVVKTISEHGQAPILEGGDWLILARNECYLNDVRGWLHSKGVPMRFPDWSPIKTEHMHAIHAFADLAAGKKVSGMAAQALYSCLRSKKHVAYGGKVRIKALEDDVKVSHDELKEGFGLVADIKTNWWDTLTKIPERDRAYYRRVKKHGESLSKQRVLLSTIHGAKGGECENVLLLTASTRQTNTVKSLGNTYRDEEHRVFYVGASRTKQNLYIMGTKYRAGREGYKLPTFTQNGGKPV